MTFRDDRDAQRHRIDSLERELVEARVEADRLREERDRAREERDAPDPPIASAFSPGTQVYVEWNGGWWDARVLKVLGSDRWRIRYDGWSSRWDEDVGRGRIATRTKPPPGRYAGRNGLGLGLRGTVLVVIALVLFAALVAMYAGGSAILGAGAEQSAAVGSVTELSVGQAVWIQWNGSWYAGSVLRVDPDGTALVHYDGYSDSFDESVTADRLRAP